MRTKNNDWKEYIESYIIFKNMILKFVVVLGSSLLMELSNFEFYASLIELT